MSSTLPPLGSFSSGTQSWGQRDSSTPIHVNANADSNTSNKNGLGVGGPVETPPFGGGGGALKYSTSGSRIGIGSGSGSATRRGNIFNQPPRPSASSSASPSVNVAPTGLFQQPKFGTSNTPVNNTIGGSSASTSTGIGGGFSFSNSISNNPSNSRGPITAAENKSLFSSSSPSMSMSTGVDSSNFGLRRRNTASSSSASTSNMNMPSSRVPPPKRSMAKMPMGGGLFHGNFNTRTMVSSDKENRQNNAMGIGSGAAQKLTLNNKSSSTTTNAIAITSTSASTSTSKTTSKSTSTFAKPKMDYKRWVVLAANPKCLPHIVSKFESYGTITSKFPTGSTSPSSSSSSTFTSSNSSTSSDWVCIQYESSLQADKAVCQHGTLYNGGNGMFSSHGIGGGGSDNAAARPTIINVHRMDETLAYNLGLKNFVELGSTGVERLGWNQDRVFAGDAVDADANASAGADDSTAGIGKGPRQAASIMDESDVLLTDEDYGTQQRRRVGGRGRGIGMDMMHRRRPMPVAAETSREDLERRDNLCEKVLAWFFEWDDSRDATFSSQ